MDTPERFTEASIRSILQKHKDVPYPSTTRRPHIAFLPEGEHRVGLFRDPTTTLKREIGIHRQGKRRTHCPNYLTIFGPPGDYPECAICTSYEQSRVWRQRREILTMIYGYLYTTSRPQGNRIR